MPTPHIAAQPEEFAPTVLMPGDPQRAQFIAETFLTDAKLITSIRGILGYTGYYKGKRVSVMASGMGIPSMGIYSHELFAFYPVENIIRIGTAGALDETMHLGDVVLGMSACTDSGFMQQFHLQGTFAPTASFPLLHSAYTKAQELQIPVRVGPILSSDVFYDETENLRRWANLGVLAVEMESAALYANAARFGKNALCICTISDGIFTGERSTVEERQTSFRRMMELALEIA